MWVLQRPGEKKEVTWEEFSEFHKDLNFNFTVSEFDCENRVEVFCKEQKIVNKVPGSDFNATHFLSQYHIQTHQGIINLKKKQQQTNKITKLQQQKRSKIRI